MAHTSWKPRLSRRRPAALAAAALLTALSVQAAAPAQASSASSAGSAPVPTSRHLAAGRYVVTLAAAPLAAYRGGVAGIAGTAPAAKGAKTDVTSADAHRYRDRLTRAQDAAAAAVGATVRRHYAVVTDGFSAHLTAAQALELSTRPGVLAVTPDGLNKADDDHSATDFLGLPGRHGVWSALGGTAEAGRGVVVGDIDTGVWPESRSFAAPRLGTAKPPAKDPYRPYRKGATTVMRKADGATFTGTCQAGEQFDADDCNRKLVGARYYADGWLAVTPAGKRADHLSPRDGQGHGTHTASTAAGNPDVPVRVDGRDLGRISGVAPAAALAVYKAFWTNTEGEATAADSDVIAAVDQAVADGVDVINYSAGAAIEKSPGDPVQQAFRTAAAAGVFVATAAGNAGPLASSEDNTAPWTTTVAASTLAPYEATVRLGDGRTFVGASTTVDAPLGPKPLLLAEQVRNAGAGPADAALCQDGTLDPAKAAGAIVVCDRGVNPRIAKSAEVKRAGGVGVVMVNTSDLDTDSDLHAVPTVHLNLPGAATVRDYAAHGGAEATLVPGGSTHQPYPQIAPFSSRGPSLRNNGDLLKPDIAAPGVGVLAAVAPPTNNGHDFDYMTGTSMATPQISGLAALYLGRHPQWSPMAVKSAMMTTAVDTRAADGSRSTDAFAQGAGEVSPRDMLDPGLVYDSSERDWLAYLEGLGVDTGSGVPATDPSDLNYPSIAVGQLVGSQTVTRKVTAVAAGTYRAQVDVPGMRTTVRPAVLHFDRPGRTRTFTVSFEQTTAPSGKLVTGSLTWRHGHTGVRSPVVLTPWSIVAPQHVAGTGGSGTVTFPVTPGTGELAIGARGPVVGPQVTGEVSTARPEQDFSFTVPEGTEAGQFFVTPRDPDARLTLVVASDPGGGRNPEIVGEPSLDNTRPEVSLNDLPPGRYLAMVFTFADTDGTPFTLQDNLVGPDTPTGPGTFRVTPTSPATVPGRPLDVTASWDGVPTDRPATGLVSYPKGADTLVTIG